MNRRRIRPASGPAQAWATLADDLARTRRAIADTYKQANDAAAVGIVSAEAARPRLHNRNNAAANEACQALMEWEQALRNEAARLQRRSDDGSIR